MIARIAEKDLIARDRQTYDSALRLLAPLNNLTQAGNFPFLDAVAFVKEQRNAGVSFPDTSEFQFSPYYDGVTQTDFMQYDEVDLLTSIGESQTAVDYPDSAKMDQSFIRSYNFRNVMYLLTELHQPMHNIIRFSSAHPEGDGFGKDHKISYKSYSNLFDAFEDAFGAFEPLSYPLTSLNALDGYVDKIMEAYPLSDLSDLANETKKDKWSKQSYDIAKSFAYTAGEGSSLSKAYVSQAEKVVKKQLAVAGYRLSNLVAYMVKSQRAGGHEE